MTAVGPAIVSGVSGPMRSTFQDISNPGGYTTAAGLHELFSAGMHTLLTTVAPIAALCMAGGVIVQRRPGLMKPTTQAIKPNFRKLNPVAGFKSGSGPAMAAKGCKALSKVVAVGSVVAMALVPQLTSLGASIDTPPAALGMLINSGIYGHRGARGNRLRADRDPRLHLSEALPPATSS